MAVPEQKTAANVTGIWATNFKLMDVGAYNRANRMINNDVRYTDPGVRRLSYIKHYHDKDGVEHLELFQENSDGTLGCVGHRTFDWKEEPCDDPLFGPSILRSKRTPVGKITNPYMKREWDQGTHKQGVVEGSLLPDKTKTAKTWTNYNVLGISLINGERRLTWVCQMTDGESAITCDFTLVFDYVGELDVGQI